MRKIVGNIVLLSFVMFLSFVPVYAAGTGGLSLRDDDNIQEVRYDHDESEFNFSFPFIRSYTKCDTLNCNSHFSRWVAEGFL